MPEQLGLQMMISCPISSSEKKIGSVGITSDANGNIVPQINIEYPLLHEGKDIGKIEIKTDDNGKIAPKVYIKCPVSHAGITGTIDTTVDSGGNVSIKCDIKGDTSGAKAAMGGIGGFR